MLKQLLLVGLGGGVGSILRFLVSKYTFGKWMLFFPAATFTVNIAGCFLIGLLTGLSLKAGYLDTAMKTLLISGFCGGFTTFSTFSLENFRMYEAGNYVGLALYVLLRNCLKMG